jgi:hypothetical protein
LRSLIVEVNADIPAASVLAQDYDLVLLSHGCFARENQRGGFDSAATSSRPCRCCEYAARPSVCSPKADRLICLVDVGRDEGEQCTCTPPASPLVRIRYVALWSHRSDWRTADASRRP